MDSSDPRPNHVAPQHGPDRGPRPLPLFLEMLARETDGAPERRSAALAGLRAYQNAQRPAPPPPLPVARRIGRTTLYQAGTGEPPLLFVPSLINPSSILDLDEERSLVRWAAAQGHAAHLLDWGYPDADERDLDVGGHVERYLLPTIAGFERPPVLVGYCLGGTMAIAAAVRAQVAGLVTIAAPWRFSGYGADARAVMAELWAAAKPACKRLGSVPTEVLQAGFWRLDPARTVAKYEAFGRVASGSAEAARFVRLEDWANAGAPLTYAAGRQLFERFVGVDEPGMGDWRVAGGVVAPDRLGCPVLEIVSTNDRIVPAATAAHLADRRELATGHVGMVVGGAREQLRRAIADWLDECITSATR
ncbi:alpha/beta fold hydrolase [Sphingomonas lenta]